MVEDHGAVTAANKVVVPHGVVEFGWEGSRFEDCGDIIIAMGGMGLSCCEMTVYETEGGIIDDETDYQCTLHRKVSKGDTGGRDGNFVAVETA
jgi:hypothetical protein